MVSLYETVFYRNVYGFIVWNCIFTWFQLENKNSIYECVWLVLYLTALCCSLFDILGVPFDCWLQCIIIFKNRSVPSYTWYFTWTVATLNSFTLVIKSFNVKNMMFKIVSIHCWQRHIVIYEVYIWLLLLPDVRNLLFRKLLVFTLTNKRRTNPQLDKIHI